MSGSLPGMTVFGEEKETLTYESPVFLDDGKSWIPEETKIQDGREYRLVSTRIRNAKKEGTLTYAQVTISYDLEGEDTVPETTDVPLTDESSGMEFERELPLMEIEEVSRTWADTLSFPVTVYGYGADRFYLGDLEIPGNADLSDYGDQIRELAGLSGECYRVELVEWDGEPYEDGDVVCRNAKASGSRLIRSVNARYGGQIRTPDLEGKQYIGIYEEVVPETEGVTEETTEMPESVAVREESTIQEIDRNGQKQGFLDSIVSWIKNHVTTVTVSIGIILLIAAGIGLFVRTGKKPGEDSP